MSLTRRRLLIYGLSAGALAAGGIPAIWTDERAVLAAVSERLFAPGVRTAPRPEELDAVDAALDYVAALPAWTRLQVRGLLRGIEWGAVSREGGRFTRLDPAAQDRFLDALATSALYPERLMFHSVKQLCAMGFYQHRLAWTLLEYPGPLVGR